jgi:hypothetical protein
MSIDKSRHIKKESMIAALETSLGVVSTACQAADIPRATYYKWLKEDDKFREQVEDINNLALDYVETSLHNQITKGNTAATIFYLKCRGKGRGYVERSELDISSKDEPIKIDIKIDGIDY